MGKETYDGEYGSRFRRSRHRAQEAERVIEGLNALPAVDLLSVEQPRAPELSAAPLTETAVPLNLEERAGLTHYLQLGGALMPHAAELHTA